VRMILLIEARGVRHVKGGTRSRHTKPDDPREAPAGPRNDREVESNDD
jgi:hypothetical protein